MLGAGGLVAPDISRLSDGDGRDHSVAKTMSVPDLSLSTEMERGKGKEG